MSKKTFNKKELIVLRKNPYVEKVSQKAITYTDEFKKIVVLNEQNAISAEKTFEDCGFDLNVIKQSRIQSAKTRWKKMYDEVGLEGLRDTRKPETITKEWEKLPLEVLIKNAEIKIEEISEQLMLIKEKYSKEQSKNK